MWFYNSITQCKNAPSIDSAIIRSVKMGIDNKCSLMGKSWLLLEQNPPGSNCKRLFIDLMPFTILLRKAMKHQSQSCSWKNYRATSRGRRYVDQQHVSAFLIWLPNRKLAWLNKQLSLRCRQSGYEEKRGSQRMFPGCCKDVASKMFPLFLSSVPLFSLRFSLGFSGSLNSAKKTYRQ